MATLAMSGIGRTFPETPPITALHGIDLVIDQGSFLAIQGPSGSGKSTLLNQLALLDEPTSGAYRIDDLPVAGLREGVRARLRSDTFGFIFQSFHLMPRRTALENVELGLLYRAVPAAERRRLAHAALVRVGLAERAGVAAQKLSGGERQRVAIARATIGGAPVVVADEPTGNLDSRSSEAIIAHLAELHAGGTTVVLVTHDSTVAAKVPAGVVLRDGAIVSRRADLSAATREAPPRIPGQASRLRVRDLLRECVRALAARPGRTTSLAAAVGIAVALIVVTLGLSQTTSAQVSSSFDILRNREVTVHVPTAASRAGAPESSGVPVDVERRLAQLRGVTSAGVLESHEPVRLSTGLVADPGANVVGGTPGALAAVGAEVTWATGRRRELRSGEVILGGYLADNVSLGPLALDPVVTLGGIQFSVVAILHASARVPGLADEVIMTRADADHVSRLDNSTVFLTTVGGAAPQVARQAPLAIDPIRWQAMVVDAPPNPVTLREAIQGDIRTALLALTLVALLASVLGVANVMVLSVVERTGELGLRRAMGARSAHIVGQTSVEATLSGVLGGFAGLVTGLAVVLGITIAHRWQPVFDLRVVPLALLGGAAVGVLGGAPASWRASRIQPADALRY